MIPSAVYELPWMKAILLARGETPAPHYQCPTCPRVEEDLVCTKLLGRADLPRFICLTCASGPHREALAVQEAAETAARDAERPWDSELGQSVKRLRTQHINDTLWTTASGSPLTDVNQEQWKAWRAAMHRLTLDFANPGAVNWPAQPGLEYGE